MAGHWPELAQGPHQWYAPVFRQPHLQLDLASGRVVDVLGFQPERIFRYWPASAGLAIVKHGDRRSFRRTTSR